MWGDVVIGVVIMHLIRVQTIVLMLSNMQDTNNTIKDTIHNSIAEIELHYMIHVILIACPILFLFTQYKRFNIIPVLKTFNMAMGIRLLVLMTNMYPDPSSICQNSQSSEIVAHISSSPHMWLESFKLVSSKYLLHPFSLTSDGNIFTTCSDLILSGHTIFHTIILCIGYTYFSHLKAFFALISIIPVLLLIVGRIHYSCDVIIAFFLTIFIWNYMIQARVKP